MHTSPPCIRPQCIHAPSELCVSEVADAQQRANLEVELQQKQSQYRECAGEPLTAAIRTSRNNIDFQGACPIFAPPASRVLLDLLRPPHLQRRVQ